MMSLRHIAIAATMLVSGPLQAVESMPAIQANRSKTSISAKPLGGELPQLGLLRDEVRGLLQAHAASKTHSEGVANILPLVRVANQLVEDPRFPTSPMLQSLRRSVFARLRKVQKKTESFVRRQKRKPIAIQIDANVLAQLNQAANVNANPGNANNLGGVDFGTQLIDLIQRTISPSSWDVNGGASTIRYWRPGMALVIRAPESIHQEMNPLLRQLRR